jgi:hypothetical protein
LTQLNTHGFHVSLWEEYLIHITLCLIPSVIAQLYWWCICSIDDRIKYSKCMFSLTRIGIKESFMHSDLKSYFAVLFVFTGFRSSKRANACPSAFTSFKYSRTRGFQNHHLVKYWTSKLSENVPLVSTSSFFKYLASIFLLLYLRLILGQVHAWSPVKKIESLWAC